LRVYKCAKCSIEDWTMKYIDGIEGRIIVRGMEYINTKDTLRLTCKRCGYHWYNEPFDKEE
jgi:predicted nucleic-acid-binding Zn-ribbon protein